jgi:hypothetical protein
MALGLYCRASDRPIAPLLATMPLKPFSRARPSRMRA